MVDIPIYSDDFLENNLQTPQPDTTATTTTLQELD